MEFAVFNRRIYTGTVSILPYPSRLAWGVVLFEGERLHGKVKLPIYDLARWAAITVDEAADAIRHFQEPDRYSSSKADDGRRLRSIEGEEDWYEIVNWDKHLDERQVYFNRLRQQRFKAKHQKVTVGNAGNAEQRSVTPGNERTGTGTGTGIEEQASSPKNPERSTSKALLSTAEPPTRPTAWDEAFERRKEEAAFKAGQPPYDLAVLLLELIRKRNPEHRQPDLQKWAREIDLMRRLDNRGVDTIREVIVWCQADEFWQNNILSTAKLRKQFDRLVLKIRQSALGADKSAPRPAAANTSNGGEIPLRDLLLEHKPEVSRILAEFGDPERSRSALQAFCEQATFIGGPADHRWARWVELCEQEGVA